MIPKQGESTCDSERERNSVRERDSLLATGESTCDSRTGKYAVRRRDSSCFGLGRGVTRVMQGNFDTVVSPHCFESKTHNQEK